MTAQNLIAVVMPNGSIQLEWAAAPATLEKSRTALQQEVHKRFSSESDPWMLYLGFSDSGVRLSESLEFWRGFAGLFAQKLLRTPDLEDLHDPIHLQATSEELQLQLDRAPLMTGSEYLNVELLGQLWSKLNLDFAAAFSAQDGSIADFVRTYHPRVHLVGRVFFHLVENRDGDAPFAFLATYSTRLNEEGKSKHLPLKHALKEYEGQKKKLLELLATVYRAARESEFISELLESGDIFHPLQWSARDAFRFLKEIPLYEKAGILCRIPAWWKSQRSGVGIDISFGEKRPSLLGMDAILSFNLTLSLGDVPVSVAEAKKLLLESEGLALIKNKWVAVDAEKLAQTLDAYEAAKAMLESGQIRMRDALRMQLHPEKLTADVPAGVDVTVSNGKWLDSVFKKLQDPARVAAVRPGKSFCGKLRAYQKRGLNWLYFLHTLGFGACLADDMGLGKTIQVLAFLSRLQSHADPGKSPAAASLLIIPASLLSNWEKEIARFCPGLKALFVHPAVNSANDLEAAYRDTLDDYDLVITTYAMATRYEWLQSHPWFYVILDEAQAIKNPATQQARGIKKFTAQNRIIMTGTPVENRLSDLWSLFDFLNPGLLGSRSEFKRFAKNLNADRSGYARLRRLIGPYILRRLKTDKQIIFDLPDKVEIKTYAALGKKQALLYGQMVDRLKTMIAEKDGMERRGVILSSLIKFKQLCNHPDQYLGSGGYAEKESGKFRRLRELCETIYEKREKALVFTQFKEIAQPLSDFLETVFQRKGLMIHGSIPVSRRKKIIDEFQQGSYVPFMVLSLKAGGVGLNLTEANHVIHFDRWWNPAVENQATDRAFRIGQKKNVMVHKFITRGTIEERIDRMIEEKVQLASDVIESSDEAWITEMDNEQIVDLFTLSLETSSG